MAIEVVIIVTDLPPLITLAAAKNLDYLLYPDLPVIIPDAVFREATAAAGKLGARNSQLVPCKHGIGEGRADTNVTG